MESIRTIDQAIQLVISVKQWRRRYDIGVSELGVSTDDNIELLLYVPPDGLVGRIVEFRGKPYEIISNEASGSGLHGNILLALTKAIWMPLRKIPILQAEAAEVAEVTGQSVKDDRELAQALDYAARQRALVPELTKQIQRILRETQNGNTAAN